MMRALVYATVFTLSCAATYAIATEKTYVGPGTWDTGSAWSPSGEPNENDHCIIPSGKVCSIDNAAVADTIDVQGTLTILSASDSLTLDGDDAGGSPVSTIGANGIINLDDNALLIFTTTSHSLNGDGKIDGIGTNNHAEVRIASGRCSRTPSAGSAARTL